MRRCPPAREPGQGGSRHGTACAPARRHPLRRATLRPAVLSALAAAAVIVVAVLVTGDFAGPLRDIAHMASPSAGASFPKGPTGHSTPQLDTTSAGPQTTAPTSVAHSTAPAQSPSQTCRAYYTSLVRPPGPSPWATRLTLLQQLTKLARTANPFQVYPYCARYVEDPFPAGTSRAGPDQAPAHTGPGSQDDGDLGQPQAPPRTAGTARAVAQSAAVRPAAPGQQRPGRSPGQRLEPLTPPARR